MADVRDILDLESPAAPELTKEAILASSDRIRKKHGSIKSVKRPEGMHREVFALLYNDNMETPPILPTDVETNPISLTRTVYNEKTATEFFQMHGIIPKQKYCDNGHVMSVSFCENNPRWRCNVRKCRTKKGIRQNTWLQNSKMTLERAAHFIYFWSEELTSVKFCAKQLEMSQPSVVDWNNYLREVCVWRVAQNNFQIGGEGLHVKIDETLYTRRKNNNGKNLPQQWIFGGMCKETKECFLVPVPQRSPETILPIMIERVKPGSIVISDDWREYNDLVNRDAHLTASHRYEFVNPDTHPQNIEWLWYSAKLNSKKRRESYKDYSESYMAEFLWKSILGEDDAFETILRDISRFWEANHEND